jgi:hypothetical protein
MKTEHSGLRSESQSFAATGGQFNDSARSGTSGLGSSISESVARGKEAIGTAANEAINATGSDLVEPLAFLLSKVVKDPSVGNPVIDRADQKSSGNRARHDGRGDWSCRQRNSTWRPRQFGGRPHRSRVDRLVAVASFSATIILDLPFRAPFERDSDQSDQAAPAAVSRRGGDPAAWGTVDPQS